MKNTPNTPNTPKKAPRLAIVTITGILQAAGFTVLDSMGAFAGSTGLKLQRHGGTALHPAAIAVLYSKGDSPRIHASEADWDAWRAAFEAEQAEILPRVAAALQAVGYSAEQVHYLGNQHCISVKRPAAA